MAADFKQLDVLINNAGLSLDRVSQALGTFVGKGNATLLDAKPLIDSMIAHSGSLQAIQAFSTAAQRVLPPGQVVADASTVEQGHGPIRAADMSHANWAYYQQHSLGAKWAQIFSDSLDAVNAAIGALPGNLTQDGDGDPVVGNWSLTAYL